MKLIGLKLKLSGIINFILRLDIGNSSISQLLLCCLLLTMASIILTLTKWGLQSYNAEMNLLNENQGVRCGFRSVFRHYCLGCGGIQKLQSLRIADAFFRNVNDNDLRTIVFKEAIRTYNSWHIWFFIADLLRYEAFNVLHCSVYFCRFCNTVFKETNTNPLLFFMCWLKAFQSVLWKPLNSLLS